MNIKRSEHEIGELQKMAEQMLMGNENSFHEKTYVQGILDTLSYLGGWETNPFESSDMGALDEQNVLSMNQLFWGKDLASIVGSDCTQ